jgi:glycosyltransferase involved in cell wall biosynthesis
MRVLKTVQSYFPFEERGGTAFKVRAIARGLAQRGHMVTVLTADLGIRQRNPDGRFERCEWGWRGNEDGVESVYLSTVAHYRAVTLNPGVVRFCGSSSERVDLIHIYGMYDLLGPAVGRFCRREGVPYVLEPMGMYRPIIRNIALKKLHLRFLGERLAAGARFVIATSEQEKRELSEAGIDAARIRIRSNGIERPGALPPRGEFRRAWNLAGNPMVLFLGRVVSKKRPDLLIQAFADWKSRSGDGRNAVLVIAGPAEESRYIPQLKALAQSLRVLDRVVFTGPLYGEKKWQAYRDADVFVLPSENENFGNTAGEAVVCGTPVIVTDQCGIAPMVERAGLVVRPDRTEIAAALGRILDDRAFGESRRRNCAEAAKALSWDEQFRECERLYQQCLDARPRQENVCVVGDDSASEIRIRNAP